ncbi:MAG: DUF6265 family protein [Vicinamibacterales bacterium]
MAGILGLGPIVPAPLAAASPNFPRWLAGCWSGARGPEQIRERWVVADDETLLGLGFTRVGAILQSFEFLRIATRGQDLVYIAQPDGAPPTEFASTRGTPTEVVFENAGHDYPRRITYRRVDINRVVTTIDDGTESGGQRFEMALTRDLCS